MKFLLIIILAISLCGCAKDEKNELKENVKTNTVEKSKTSEVNKDDFKIKHINSIFENNNSVFEIEITNNSNKISSFKELEVQVLDQNNNVLAILYGYLENELNPGEKELVRCSYGGDLSKFKSLNYKIS